MSKRAGKAKKLANRAPLPVVNTRRPGLRGWSSTLYRLLAPRLRLISLIGGAVAISAWTFVRTMNNGVNYDVIGQINLADQWSQGQLGGSEIGSTNYVLKMPIYFLMNGLEFLSPRIRLTLLALGFNLLAFYLIFKTAEKLLDLYKVADKSWLYIALLWLATISDRVFWLDYPNSRNLEVAGGLYLIYILLLTLQRRSRRLIVTSALVGGVVFFADPLQLFTIGAPAAIYFAAQYVRHRTLDRRTNALVAVSAIAGAFIVSRALFWFSSRLLPISYLKVPSFTPSFTFTNAMASIKNTVLSSISLFDSNFLPFRGVNSLRQVINAAVLLGVVALIIAAVRDKEHTRFPKLFWLFLLLLIDLMYIVSGQALRVRTSRYLIMASIVTIVFVALLAERHVGKYKRVIQLSWLLGIGLSAVLIAGAVVKSLPQRYAKDDHLLTIARYMEQNHYPFLVSSREFSLPTNYFMDGRMAIPVRCTSQHRLQQTDLFFDTAAYQDLAAYRGEVPVLLYAVNATRQNELCTDAAVIAQFGIPKRTTTISGVGDVYVYDSQKLHIDPLRHP